jgi:hypothetical protein
MTVSANYTATASDYTILCNVNGMTLSLPQASTVPGRVYLIKKIASGGTVITVDPYGSELIDGATTSIIVKNQWASMMIQCDGSAWYILASR